MTRLSLSMPAEREARPARILLSGLNAPDLTLTAFTLAAGLAAGDAFLVIDTERRTALTHAGAFEFEHLPWAAPYDPTELAHDMFEGARRWPVVVIDCLSRFWGDSGGVRDIADGVGRGLKPSGWDNARPAHRRLMAALTEARAHVIVTCRTQVETVAGVDLAGQPVVTLLPGRIMQDDLVAAEMDVHGRVDAATRILRVESSRIPTIRPGLLVDPVELDDVAATYREWCEQGAAMADLDEVQLLRERLDRIHPGDDKPAREARAAAKQRFVQALGLPQHLRARQMAEANALAKQLEDEAAGHGDPAARANRMVDTVRSDKAGAQTGKDAAADQVSA
jgi:hypothetical protein